jgi:putative NIF3 family GTP cyclohydrolase 1 type 2
MSSHAKGVSRRSFVAASVATFLSTSLLETHGRSELLQAHGRSEQVKTQGRGGLTAQQVVARIQASVDVPWRDKTVDTFKAGDPATLVTGIATTAMATLGVLRQAASARRNLIITSEPTFYTTADDPGDRAADPVYLAKKAFIDQHGLVLWRFTDHWLARQPLESPRALASALGWSAGRTDNERIYQIPPATLGAVAAHVRTSLAIKGGLRIIGKHEAPVRRVVLSPGTTDLASTIANLRDADLIVSGEPREWEVVEYVADTASAGAAKSLIAVGRILSEQPGMQACAAWLKTLLPDVPVEAIGLEDPYWRPAV